MKGDVTMTTEKINELIRAVPERSFLRLDNTKDIFEYCKEEGMTDLIFKVAHGALFNAVNAAFAIGFNRGRNYQKRHNKSL